MGRTMGRWIRLYEGALEDPKVQRLPDLLFKFWINTLLLAGRGDGVLPSSADIGFALRTSEKEAARRVAELIDKGLVDRVGDVLRPHNWDGRQFMGDTSTERARHFRDRQKGKAAPSHATLHETRTQRDDDGDAALIDDEAQRVDRASISVAETPYATPPETETETETKIDTVSSSSSAADQRPDDDEMRNKLKEAAKGHLGRGCANVEPLRKLLAEGVGWESDVLTFVAERIPTLKNPLGSWGASWVADDIRAWSQARRAPAQLAAVGAAPEPNPMIFIAQSSPEWERAAVLYRRERRSKIGPPTSEKYGPPGWYFSRELLAGDKNLSAKFGLKEAAE